MSKQIYPDQQLEPPPPKKKPSLAALSSGSKRGYEAHSMFTFSMVSIFPPSVSPLMSTPSVLCVTHFLLRFQCAQNNPDETSLEARLLNKLKNDPSNNGKILVTLEHIAEWQPSCWERRSYKYQW